MLAWLSSKVQAIRSWFQQHPRTTKVLQIAFIGGGFALLATAVVGIVLGAVGFGPAGVVAGSSAALWQAAIGNVAAGSLFAGLQSLGAVGLSAGAASAIGGGTALVAAVII